MYDYGRVALFVYQFIYYALVGINYSIVPFLGSAAVWPIISHCTFDSFRFISSNLYEVLLKADTITSYIKTYLVSSHSAYSPIIVYCGLCTMVVHTWVSTSKSPYSMWFCCKPIILKNITTVMKWADTNFLVKQSYRDLMGSVIYT